MRLCVVGTGYVGLVTAAGFAELGHTVVAVDKNPQTVAQLSRGVPPFYEPGLDELLARNLAAGRLTFTTDPREGVRRSEVVFVCVGTPSRPDGSADVAQVEEVARTIAPMVNGGYRLIVEKSTVPVHTAYWIERTIRRYAPGADGFEVASNPEFLREGSAVRDFLYPDRVILGVPSDRARDLLLDLYRDLQCPVVVTDVRTAELIKHAANAFLATKISFINMVADLCEAVGVDVSVVARGMGLDPRIGRANLDAGLGFGGSCFPKDLRAFVRIAEEYGLDFGLLREAERINEQRVERFLRKLERALWVVRDKTIAVLGVAFKPNTDDIREAPSLKVVPRLLEAGARLKIYDPRAAGNFARVFPPGDAVVYTGSPYEAAEGAHAVAVLTEWDEFRDLDLDRLRSLMRTPIVVDGRNLFDPRAMQAAGFEYYSLGRGDAAPATAPSPILSSPQAPGGQP